MSAPATSETSGVTSAVTRWSGFKWRRQYEADAVVVAADDDDVDVDVAAASTLF